MGGRACATPATNSLELLREAGIHYPNQTARQGHSNKLQPIDALCELTAPAHGQSGRPSLASGRALTGSSPHQCRSNMRCNPFAGRQGKHRGSRKGLQFRAQ